MKMTWTVLLLLMAPCLRAADPVLPEPVWQQPDDPVEPYRVEQLRQWHEAWGKHWPWGQPEYSLHLRDDDSEQLLLMISGYARGGEFALFLPHGHSWIASTQHIELAHHPLQVLPAQREGWHEFETYVPAWGSGGAEVWVFRYGWSGHDYVQLEQRDSQWCALRYFQQTMPELCSGQ